MKPTFIGLGAQKAASSWIYTVLKDHPQIGVSEPKELDFFSNFYEFGFQWYERFFDDCRGCRAVGEVSPTYLPSVEAPARARDYDPELRIVVSLRDPVARALSNHLHEVREGRLDKSDLSFETGLANSPMYVERSRYAAQLRRWFDMFDREQVLVLLQEEIVAAPEAHARLLYRHLGVDEDYQSPFSDTHVNRSYVAKSPAREAAVRHIGAAMRWIGGAHSVEAIKKIEVVRRFREANRVDIRELVPPVRPEPRAWLEAELAEDVLDLAHLLGRESLPWPTWERAAEAQDAADPVVAAPISRVASA